jgi:hypothetical protein
MPCVASDVRGISVAFASNVLFLTLLAPADASWFVDDFVELAWRGSAIATSFGLVAALGMSIAVKREQARSRNEDRNISLD